MEQRLYECLLALDTGLSSADSDALVGKITQLVEQAGGKIQASERLGTRKLAFKVHGKIEAAFHQVTFEGVPTLVRQIEDVLRLHEGVLRYMTTRLTGVAQASQAQTPPSS